MGDSTTLITMAGEETALISWLMATPETTRLSHLQFSELHHIIIGGVHIWIHCTVYMGSLLD